MKELYDRGAAQKIAERFGEQTDFANRRTLFTMGSTSGLPFYRSAVEESEVGPFEWSVAAIPHSTPRPVMNMYGASWSIPATTPEQQLAAWLFVKYMTEVEVQREWVDASGYFPVRASAREGLGDYFVENTQYSAAFEVLLSADVRTEPPFASYEEVRRLISATFNDVLDGADIATALEELTDEANLINADMLP